MAFIEQNLKQKLDLRLSQKLALTPALQQAIKLLQLTVPELQQEIKKELLENPLLEEVRDIEEKEPEQKKEETNDLLHEKDINIEDFFRDYFDDQYVPKSRNKEYEDNDFNYENFVSKPQSLKEYLEWQAGINIEDEKVYNAVLMIIPYIDDNGYLKVPEELKTRYQNVIDYLSNELKLEKSLIEDAIKEIQKFDPTGVGATSVEECLWLQSCYLGFEKDEILRKMIFNHLEDIASNQTSKIALVLGITEEDVKNYIDFIKKLEPKPGRKYASERTQYIIPDVIVFKVDDEYYVDLNEDGIPGLKVNRQYAEMLKNRDKIEKETEAYIKEKLKSALWLIKSIHNRQKTILKVAKSIVNRQRDFFDFGVEYMKPLTLKDIADELGIHESTVARVVKNKYMQTPRGVFELKYFFSSKLGTSSGIDVSAMAVKEKIRRIIENENKNKPYSDSEIVKILLSQGIKIARRTVAKYREELGIESSSKRKIYYRRKYEN
ncbi:RNA polymerase sigma-54 factor [Thermotomaculum hydrothermale]|uniref:RNA polymerase sigma-54 factor n=1 Tax=Thermotomaculum hydrothermale TaxID=981385 RepID=A0A7R6PGQ9_9BACT|nr:RNA polymerase factor sigma-54 [Thermotomaculum hydrothermale]BBB32304.1 RNA polymerase sigma-54 factor [Thermotomaculum hydrothermale]